ncbi:MAG: DUF2357 domain-containing protein [Methanobrevibacter sp.]|uniref:DUF2357 domain-containing protein n=1 Tax=Methanobrevibacter sp. TaxID=66852 RepID=UPI0025E130C8|nr:DUF2357 domain-containing protein [Methanobrevibacter sp.]MBR3112835.1 DUF2357 domain-containing protein [Methanobrevibacter sp.]MBR4634422.1 DUF2357 domain-containing protein [bacterium]
MIEQKVIIHLTDEDSNEIGTLTVSSLDYVGEFNDGRDISQSITLKCVPIVDEPDNLTPIQYCPNIGISFAKLMFLEETEYQILFESKDTKADFKVLYSLTKINDNHFKPFRFSLGDDKSYKIAGTLNFRSYVGKSFLDVKKNNLNSIKIPIEVRSKKIDYFNQYSAMIADLSQHALSLIFEVKSPLYQEFELDLRQKETYYEDFMFLEYLFRQENLPSIFEYLSKNLHSQLKNHTETVPLSFASNVNQNTLKNIVSKPNNLFKSDANFEIVHKLNGYIPREIEQIKHEDVIDIPENRFFKYFLELVRDLVEKLLETSKEGYINDKLLSFRNEIGYYLSAKFFNHISTMEYVPFNSQILQKKEGYREIFQYFLMLEFSFRLSWDEVNEQFKGFEKKLSELYEYWCYFKLLKVLNDMSVNKINFEDVFEINKDNWSISIKRGEKSRKKFKLFLHDQEIDVELFYNLRFSEGSEYRSYSLAFRPDYTLRVKIGKHINYIHFDAKYRSELQIANFYGIVKSDKELDEEIDERDSLEEKDYVFKDGDIYKMHTYKDSILKTEGAYVLYPGNKTKRFYESDLIIPSVGAFSLTPGNVDVDEDNLESFIKGVLKTLLFYHGLIVYEWGSSCNSDF